MKINGNGRDVSIECSLDELKEIYRALFKAMDIKSGDIDPGDSLIDLQTYLYAEAARQGVNLDDHAEWERFIGRPECDRAPCERTPPDCPYRSDKSAA